MMKKFNALKVHNFGNHLVFCHNDLEINYWNMVSTYQSHLPGMRATPVCLVIAVQCWTAVSQLVEPALLLEGCWFDLPACRSVLRHDTESQTAPDVLVSTLHGSHHHNCMNGCMNNCKLLWTEASGECPKMWMWMLDVSLVAAKVEQGQTFLSDDPAISCPHPIALTPQCVKASPDSKIFVAQIWPLADTLTRTTYHVQWWHLGGSLLFARSEPQAVPCMAKCQSSANWITRTLFYSGGLDMAQSWFILCFPLWSSK